MNRLLLGARLGLLLVWSSAALADIAPFATVHGFPITGASAPALREVDELVTRYLEAHDIPAATLAIMRDGRMVLWHGYGYSDERRTVPLPFNALMRVASVSKPITAAAIQKLIGLGKLSGSTRVFPYLGLRPHNGVMGDPRLDQVTVHDLICHQGGWDDAVASPAPAWSDIEVARIVGIRSPPAPEDRIRYMLALRLQHDPASYPEDSKAWECTGPSWYSNFGYVVLGRVIEKASGMSFIDAVHKLVFQSARSGDLEESANDVLVGHTFQDQLLPREVKFYSDRELVPNIESPERKVRSPFGGWKHEYMDSTGGIVANAGALVAFAQNYWYFGQPREGGANWYSFYKSGSAPGTFAALLWNPWNGTLSVKGINYALIMNQREDAAHPGRSYDDLVQKLNDWMAGSYSH